MDDGFVQICVDDGAQAGSGSHDHPDPQPVSARRAGMVLVGIGACLVWPVPLGGALVMATGLIGSTFVTWTGAAGGSIPTSGWIPPTDRSPSD